MGGVVRLRGVVPSRASAALLRGKTGFPAAQRSGWGLCLDGNIVGEDEGERSAGGGTARGGFEVADAEGAPRLICAVDAGVMERPVVEEDDLTARHLE